MRPRRPRCGRGPARGRSLLRPQALPGRATHLEDRMGPGTVPLPASSPLLLHADPTTRAIKLHLAQRLFGSPLPAVRSFIDAILALERTAATIRTAALDRR